MKGTALSALFAAATLLASPAFAAEKDLCALNLQEINDTMATAGATSEGLKTQIDDEVTKAKDAQAKGNDKDCIAITQKALTTLQNTNKGSGSSSGGA